MDKYIKVKIDNEVVDYDVRGDFPISIDYQLEDVNDFQKKKSSEALNIKLPGTLRNDQIFNTFHNASVEDTSANNSFRGIRNIVIEANGDEVLVGKNFLKKSKSQYGRPKSYEISAYGNNADWMIDLKEVTLYDILKEKSLVFVAETVTDSWAFDGTDENLPYVFAPVKFASFMDPVGFTDSNYSLLSMRPSLSNYWIIFWAFKSLGYRIESNFIHSNYFRRKVMPWTFGNFLTTEGTKYDIHKILAKGTGEFTKRGNYSAFWNLDVTNDFTDGGFDNNTVNHPDPNGGDYTYHVANNNEMRWTYNTPHYGTLQVQLSTTIQINAACNSGAVILSVRWFKKSAITGIETFIKTDVLCDISVSIGGESFFGLETSSCETIVENGDSISARVFLDQGEDKLGFCRCYATLMEFKTDFFKIPPGGTVSFDSLIGLKNHKFLDLLRGEADNFNLSFQTDPIKKVVVIQPTHDYSIVDDLTNSTQGYFKKEYEKWSDKRDISIESEMELFSNYQRELIFKYKDDSADGAYKLVKDRNVSDLGKGKYLFPERFKAGKQEYENRFFSPTMHFEATSFKDITGVPPQMICLVPENISNTSSSESENTFMPKNAWYKGLQSGVGGWRFNGTEYTTYPFMFAVNYKVGGQNDPILSYCDEKIGIVDSPVLGKGLLKRFFWQRLAIMRNGQYLKENFKLNNKDITNWFHRERIDLNGNLFELIAINNFKPMVDDSTECNLRRFAPISQKDLLATYPTSTSVLNDSIDGSSYDLKYNRLMCLATDIPTPTIG